MSSHRFNNVIVFGPTGGVGGVTALHAEKRGASVWLAMRDTSKPIAEIPVDVEKAGKFIRVQADLTDPASITKAVQQSGAKAAYIYLIPTAEDHMRGSLQALRDAGVDNLVFLSTFSITSSQALSSVSPEDFIPYTHAQVEIAAEQLRFPHFVALRPAEFASNWFKNFLDRSVSPPKANYIQADAVGDNIAPEDIGELAAVVLTERPSAGTEVIYQCGPELRTAGESWELVKKITGRDDIDTTPTSKDIFIDAMAAKGIPRPLVEYVAKSRENRSNPNMLYPELFYGAAVANTKKYTGREPMKFTEYIEKHKAEWQAV